MAALIPMAEAVASFAARNPKITSSIAGRVFKKGEEEIKRLRGFSRRKRMSKRRSIKMSRKYKKSKRIKKLSKRKIQKFKKRTRHS